jgi:hypothetical protein
VVGIGGRLLQLLQLHQPIHALKLLPVQAPPMVPPLMPAPLLLRQLPPDLSALHCNEARRCSISITNAIVPLQIAPIETVTGGHDNRGSTPHAIMITYDIAYDVHHDIVSVDVRCRYVRHISRTGRTMGYDAMSYVCYARYSSGNCTGISYTTSYLLSQDIQ